jgi:hypothetical protein
MMYFEECRFLDLMPCGSCENRVRKEYVTTIISVKRISKFETPLAVSSNNLVTANADPISLIPYTLTVQGHVTSKRRFLQEPHGVSSQMMTFFIATAVKTSNLT